MSKIEKMIREFCPDGVRYLTISELFNTRNGYTPSKANKEFWEDGTVPWFRMEDIRENGRILSKSAQYVSKKAIKGSLFPANSMIVATSATIGEHALITVPSLANQRFTYLMPRDEFRSSIDMKFVHYYCFKLDKYCKTHLNQGNFASVDMKKFTQFRFPVPPLEVQREIVRILDNFTDLTAELTAELTARKKQYDYYRDKFLSFDHCSEDNYSAKRYKLSALCYEITDGSHYSPPAADEGYYMPSVKDMRANGFVYTDCKKISPKAYEKLVRNGCRPQKNDVLIAKDGATMLKHAFVSDGSEDIVLLSSIAILRPKTDLILPQYLAHCFRQNSFKENVIRRFSTEGGVPRIVLKNFKQIELTVPCIEEQSRIVTILDRFEALCSNLTSGLPAEIAARQKQYEYYRDKLLTFKELA